MEKKGIETPYENWTRFPNCILDNLENFKSSEIHILCLMVRKNVGWENSTKEFSLSYIEKKTGLSRKTVVSVISGLLKKGAIVELETGKNGINRYEINWIQAESQVVEKIPQCKKYTGGKNTLSGSGKITPQVVENFHPVKDTIHKDTIHKRNHKRTDDHSCIKKEDSFCQPEKPDLTPPEGVDPDNWTLFMEVREKRKTVNSALAIKKIHNKLAQLVAAGHDPNTVVENSALSGWPNLYEPKTNGQRAGKYANHPAVVANKISADRMQMAENLANIMKRQQEKANENNRPESKDVSCHVRNL